jgi:hypothetical protein
VSPSFPAPFLIIHDHDLSNQPSERIVDTTVLRLTDEEAAMLPESTAELSYFNNQVGYVGVLEVFHQLHCLVSAPFLCKERSIS